ncbi:hypothetical protein EDB83DRAFT_2523323 [Lactarius deliciosus]|nr:hypothetical protein EDB83DRAFT_2523323 [Lactarius deliciosus]
MRRDMDVIPKLLALGLLRLLCCPRMNTHPLNIHPHIHPRLNTYQNQVPIPPSQPIKYGPMHPLPIRTCRPERIEV